MRVLSRFALALALVLPICLSLVSAGCSDSTNPPDGSVTTCTEDEDCPTGEYCQEGVCTPTTVACEDGGTCPEGMVCDDGVCVPDNDGGLDGGDGGDGDEGPAPDIEVISPTLSDGQYQLDFGDVLIGVPVTGQVTLENAGDADLRIMQLNFEMGTDVEDFSIPAETLDALPLVIPPGEQMTFDIVYAASDGQTDHGILDVISNDPDEALVQIHLISEFKGLAQVQVSPRALPFGDVPVGQTSQPLTFTISNSGTGNAVLQVDDVRTEVVGNPNYSLEVFDSDSNPVDLPVLLNRGDFLDVDVVFAPQSNAEHTDNIVVLTDDANDPALMVAVSGRGVVGDLTIDPSPAALGRVRVGSHAELPITITNSGGAALDITGIALQDLGPTLTLGSTDVDLVDLPNNPHSLDSGAFITVLLSFDPDDVGFEEGSLLIDNTGGDPQRLVAISAEGYVPAAVETNPPGPPDGPVSLSFGDVQMDFGSGTAEVATFNVTISNIGGEPLVISNIQRSGTGLDFSYTPGSIPPIDVSQEAVLQVAFEPTTLGSQTASILLETNDPDIEADGVTGRFRIDTQANGIDPNVFVSPTSKDFEQVYVGQQVSQQFRIQNAGFGPLVIESIELTAGSSNSFELLNLPALPMVISNAMMEINFDVTYQPASLGEDVGAVEVVNSDIGNPNVLLDLTGTGAGCPANQIDCNGNPQDGCEVACVPSGAEQCNYLDDDCDCDTDEDYDTDIDVNNCGNCGTICSYQNGQPSCVNGSCQLATCLSGWADCNVFDGDGCEINTNNDEANCGDCDNACSFDQAEAACLGGTCVMGDCDPGYADCNGSDADGCETNTLNDPDNCSSCGNRCLYANGTGRCLGGTCDLDSCLPGFQNCNFIDGDGCEVNLLTDPDHCGDCATDCPPSGGNPVCNNGTCGVSGCLPGFADCDANPADCETDIANDPGNCGGCGTICNLDNASADCLNQTCVVDGCDPGWGDCNAQDPDGCETDTSNTTQHCGFCGNSCNFDHASGLCQSSTCVLDSCDPGFYNIDGNPLTGCECAEDNISDLCDDATIEDLGVLSDGAVVVLTGNLIPDDLDTDRDVDWFTFTAPDNNVADINNGSDDYHVHIEFDPGSGNPDNMYAFDVYRHPNTSAGCVEKGNRVCNWADVEYDYLSGQAPCRTSTYGPGAPLCEDDGARYWLRVYRSGALVNCTPYSINITFTQ